MPAYARDHYIAEVDLGAATKELVGHCLGHLARAKGHVVVKELTIELLREFYDYFLPLIRDKELTARCANKHLRQLRAIANHAAEIDGLVKPVKYRKFFPVTECDPHPFDRGECQKIEAASQAVTGSVGTLTRDGFCVPAAIWWHALWRALLDSGCRITVLMLAVRGDYRNGVLWLRKEHQKQKQHQKIELRPRTRLAIENLLAAHDDPRLLPWPFDPVKPGRKPNWKTLYKHFQKLLLDPGGITRPKGQKTRVCRQTAGTNVEDSGGSGQRLLGHKSRATTDEHYLPHDRVPVIKDALLVAEFDVAVQRTLFQTEGEG